MPIEDFTISIELSSFTHWNFEFWWPSKKDNGEGTIDSWGFTICIWCLHLYGTAIQKQK